MATVKFFKLNVLPSTPEANSLYVIKDGVTKAKMFITGKTGVAHAVNPDGDIVSTLNGQSGSINMGLSFSGGSLSIVLGNQNAVDLDTRYLQITDAQSPNWGLIGGDIFDQTDLINYINTHGGGAISGDRNVDGGTPESIYLPSQKLDGGEP